VSKKERKELQSAVRFVKRRKQKSKVIITLGMFRHVNIAVGVIFVTSYGMTIIYPQDPVRNVIVLCVGHVFVIIVRVLKESMIDVVFVLKERALFFRCLYE